MMFFGDRAVIAHDQRRLAIRLMAEVGTGCLLGKAGDPVSPTNRGGRSEFHPFWMDSDLRMTNCRLRIHAQVLRENPRPSNSRAWVNLVAEEPPKRPTLQRPWQQHHESPANVSQHAPKPPDKGFHKLRPS